MLVSERITGTGAVQALDLAVGVPLWEIEPALALVVGALLLAGLTPPREKPPPGTPPVPLNATIQAFMLRAAHLGLVFFAEPVRPLTMLGAALIVAGCFIAVRKPPPLADGIVEV